MVHILHKWAIMHVPTRRYLPRALGRSGRGSSHTEPMEFNDHPRKHPAIFDTELSAKRTLAAWLQGRFMCSRSGDWEDYNEDIWVVPQPHRIKEDMLVVKIEIRFPL